MPINRAAVETALISRIGRRFTFIKLNGTTHDGTNADLNDPIREALGYLGVVPVDPTAIADVDFATVTAGGLTKLYDVAELRCLETVAGNWDQFDQTKGISQQMLGKMLDSLLALIKDKRAAILAQYGIGLGQLTGGGVTVRQRRGGCTEF